MNFLFKNKLLILVLSLITILFLYIFIHLMVDNKNFKNFKTLLSLEKRDIIRKYIFPYRQISIQEKKILEKDKLIKNLELNLIELELRFKKSNNDIHLKKINFQLSNDITLEKYELLDGFHSGIANLFPGSGYIEFHENNLFVLSSRGVLAYTENLNEETLFKQIRNNINDYIGIDQFSKSHRFSIKDLFINKKKIFVSYTEEVNKDCWNTSIIYGDIDYENIQFKKLFSDDECIHSINNIDKEFSVHQSGGRMTEFNENNILFSIGDYRKRSLAQNKNSINGKILTININDGEYQIISMGHRNPQGLYFDKENNFILETEHGPMGGDEINLINIKKMNKEKILNFGWPIVSAGEHYGGKGGDNKKKYEKYPLYKSHTKYGFIEPKKSFVPSIGISEITKLNQNKYVVSSLQDKSLYFFDLNPNNEISNLKRVEVFERVRDLKFNNNILYLFLEDTASIGKVKLN